MTVASASPAADSAGFFGLARSPRGARLQAATFAPAYPARVAADVDLLVNCYERTYRDVTRRGFFDEIDSQVGGRFTARYLLINNVEDQSDAEERALGLQRSGEITAFAFVSDLLADALAVTQVPPRALRRAGYLLDYGLVMSVLGASPYLVGWDAECRLEAHYDWVSPGIDLLATTPRVFSVNPDWPTRGETESTMRMESFANEGAYFINYGFCDQMFLVRRAELAAPIYTRVSPCVLAMRAESPRTFEARVESYQRATARVRATDSRVRYTHNDLAHPLERAGQLTGSRYVSYRALRYARRLLVDRLPSGPRLRAFPPAPDRRRGGWAWNETNS